MCALLTALTLVRALASRAQHRAMGQHTKGATPTVAGGIATPAVQQECRAEPFPLPPPTGGVGVASKKGCNCELDFVVQGWGGGRVPNSRKLGSKPKEFTLDQT